MDLNKAISSDCLIGILQLASSIELKIILSHRIAILQRLERHVVIHRSCIRFSENSDDDMSAQPIAHVQAYKLGDSNHLGRHMSPWSMVKGVTRGGLESDRSARWEHAWGGL